MKFKILICCCYAFFSAALTTSAQCNYIISALIQDKTNQHQLENASVFLYQNDALVMGLSTKPYTFVALCKGEYELIITSIGFDTLHQHIDLSANWNGIIDLVPKNKALQEIQFVGSSYHKQSTAIDQERLASAKGLPIAELLAKINGIQLLQTGATISKPVINGLSGNRVVLINNGVRLESQQWGNDHAPEIDAFSTEQVKLVYGAEQLKYGGDVIGGLVVMDKNTIVADSHFHGRVYFASNSNNRLLAMHHSIEGLTGKKKVNAIRWQTSIRKAGDSKTPNYNLSNTGFSEVNTSLELLKERANKTTTFSTSVFASRLGVFAGAHIGNITDLQNILKDGEVPNYIKDIPFSYSLQKPMQQVMHWTSRFHQIRKIKSTHLEHKLNLQWNYRAEYDKKKFTSSSNAPQLSLHLVTLSHELHFKKSNNKLTHNYGLQHWLQINTYQARLFIPNYQLYQVAPYYFAQYKMGKSFVEAGLRFDNRYQWNINSNRERKWTNRMFTSVSSNLNYGRNWQRNFVSINASLAMRAPNMNELYSDGLHHGAARIERGDSMLKQEKATSISAIHKFKSTTVEATSIIGAKFINDFIYLTPSFPPQLTIRGAFPLFTFQQTNANLYSFTHQNLFHISDHWKINSSVSLLYAWDTKDDQWIAQMPANYGAVGLQYKIADRGIFNNNTIGLDATFVSEQNRIPTTGNIPIVNASNDTTWAADYMAPPMRYAFVNAQLSTNVQIKNKSIPVIFGVQNIFNTSYRNYLNAFRYFSDETGRNFSVRVQYRY